MGPERTKAMVNSLPVGFYWVVLILVLLAAIVTIPSLRRSGGLGLLHLGPALVIIGGIWGSSAGHLIRQYVTGSQKVPSGQMVLLEGAQQDQIGLADGRAFRLPFAVRLARFEIQYYSPGFITIRTGGAEMIRLPAVPGRSCSIGPGAVRLEVLQVFENLKVDIGSEGKHIYDDPNGPSNPAVAVRLIEEDGSARQIYLFARYNQWHGTSGGLEMAYSRPIKDFISHIEVLQSGRVVTSKAVEVNRPLHHAGYYLLQASYGIDPQTGRSYSVLSVVSDSGLWLVFAGYGLIIFGMVWQLWINRIVISHMRNKRPV